MITCVRNVDFTIRTDPNVTRIIKLSYTRPFLSKCAKKIITQKIILTTLKSLMITCVRNVDFTIRTDPNVTRIIKLSYTRPFLSKCAKKIITQKINNLTTRKIQKLFTFCIFLFVKLLIF